MCEQYQPNYSAALFRFPALANLGHRLCLFGATGSDWLTGLLADRLRMHERSVAVRVAAKADI